MSFWQTCPSGMIPSIWQFDINYNIITSRVPEWLFKNCRWTMLRTTEHNQWIFDQYGASFNQRKLMYNCCWNWTILPRCVLQSSVAWNSCQNHQSWPQHEKNLCKMGSEIVGWRAQMEPSGCGLRLHVPLPYQRGGSVQQDSHRRWEMGPSFHTKMKSASQQWVVKGDNHPVKAKQEKSARKVYLTAFWDNQSAFCWRNTPEKVSQQRRRLT